MINGKKIVVVTPAGRKRYMEILFQYLLKERDIIDEYRIWVNTQEQEDINYFNSLKEQYPDFVTLDSRFYDAGNMDGIYQFFDKCIDSDTVYIRLDDDMVWVEDNFIRKMAEFRINNPTPFLIYGTILNNAIIDSVLQNLGMYDGFPILNYDCLDSVGWNDPYVCEMKHRYLIDNFLSKSIKLPFLFRGWVCKYFERVSINCISWYGEEFAKFGGKVGIYEEEWLSTEYPKEINKPNLIFGGAYCVHYAFHRQRPYLDTTDILEKYKQLIDKK